MGACCGNGEGRVTHGWMVTDRHDLPRFVDAQSGMFDEVRSELRAGRKTGHWIWFIFPQFDGLGHSAAARQFAISSREEAAAYAAHPILGSRLRECTSLVNAIAGRGIRQILGTPDDLKFRSSMTLFAQVCPDDPIFGEAINKYYGGEFDALTMDLLRSVDSKQ
jgi:uncharacterized protein (DUF1810 family)